MHRQPLHRADAALAAGRVLAWALLIGGWLGLGSLGRQHLPLLAGGMLPMALWLLAIGITLGLVQRRLWSANGVSALLAAGLLLAAMGVALISATPLGGMVALACGWAVSLVGASLTVRRLRQVAGNAPPPASAAFMGAALAWSAWAGPLTKVLGQHGVLWLGAFATLLSTALLRSPGPAIRACRSGLFDCALALGSAADWRDPQRRPAAVAALAMLPMMATLAMLDDACSAQGLTRGQASALHLLAMLLPAWMVLRWSARRAVPRSMPSLPLALGGIALLLVPGQSGLMAAGLLHGMAWSLSWAGRWHAPPRTESSNVRPRMRTRLAGAAGWVIAMSVLALGQLSAEFGPDALWVLHLMLAIAATATGCAALRRDAAKRLQSPEPDPASIGRPIARL